VGTYNDRYTETEEEQAPGIFDADVLERLSSMGIKDQDTLRGLLNSSLRVALGESQPKQPTQPQSQPQEQPDQADLALKYSQEMRGATGNKTKLEAIKSKYQEAGLNTDLASPISGRYYGSLPQQAEQPQADPLEAQYKSEVLASRGKGFQVLNQIKSKYKKLGFDPEGVSFRP
jgi:hypothetical protein